VADDGCERKQAQSQVWQALAAINTGANFILIAKEAGCHVFLRGFKNR
jgi:hypothetical protein